MTFQEKACRYFTITDKRLDLAVTYHSAATLRHHKLKVKFTFTDTAVFIKFACLLHTGLQRVIIPYCRGAEDIDVFVRLSHCYVVAARASWFND